MNQICFSIWTQGLILEGFFKKSSQVELPSSHFLWLKRQSQIEHVNHYHKTMKARTKSKEQYKHKKSRFSLSAIKGQFWHNFGWNSYMYMNILYNHKNWSWYTVGIWCILFFNWEQYKIVKNKINEKSIKQSRANARISDDYRL